MEAGQPSVRERCGARTKDADESAGADGRASRGSAGLRIAFPAKGARGSASLRRVSFSHAFLGDEKIQNQNEFSAKFLSLYRSIKK